MIERETDQSRGERLCFASPSCGCSQRGLVCSRVGLKPSASPGDAAQLLAASLLLRSYIRSPW